MSRFFLARLSFGESPFFKLSAALHASQAISAMKNSWGESLGPSWSGSWFDRFGGWGVRSQENAPPPGHVPPAGETLPETQAAIEDEANAGSAPAAAKGNASTAPTSDPDSGPHGVETGTAHADVEAPAEAIEDLLIGDAYRLNASQPLGTATSVTYAFLDAVPDYYKRYDWADNDFRPFSAQQQEMTRGALSMIESYSNLSFVETAADAASITFGIADLPGDWIGYAYYPIGETVGRKAADVWIDTEWAGARFTPGTEPYKTLLHEIGHAIGLDHPGSLSGDEDSRMYTVMSANEHPNAKGEPQTHMLYDIAAVQHIYGANTDHAAGDDVYDFGALADRTLTIWDAGGIDTFNLREAPYAVEIDLRQGAFSTVAKSANDNIAIAYGTTIENAFGGAGDDTLTGNAVGNRLDGGPGNDVLTGGGGNNVFVFGPEWGHDTITDFARGVDRLDLRDTKLAFADLQIFSAGSAIRVAHDDNQITLPGVDALSENDFLFSETTLLA
jgi:hypothetical protein